MKKCIITGFFLVLSLCVRAQEFQVEWGPELKDPKKTQISDILGRDDNYFYALRTQYKGSDRGYFTLECYDNKTMALKYSKEVEEEIKERVKDAGEMKSKNLNIQDMYMMHDKMILLLSYYDSKADIKTLFATQVKLSDGSVSPQLQKLDEVREVKKSSRGGFSYALSHDSTKLLVYHNEVFDKNMPERYAAKLYSNDLKLIWAKDFQMQQTDRDVQLGVFHVDPDGNFYILAKMLEKIKGKGAKNPNYYYQIVSYVPGKDSIRLYELKIGEKFITDIYFELTKDKNLICAGFYSDRNKSDKSGDAKFDRANGVFYLKVDGKTREVLKSQIKEFDRNIFSEMIRREKKAAKEDEASQFDIRDFIFGEDGSMSMITEQYFVNVVCTTDPKTGAQSCRYYYNYNHMLIANFSSDGIVNWMKIVPKYQVTVNDGGYYSSYMTVVGKDKLFFVYNDDPKNEKINSVKDGLRPMTSPKKSMTMIASLDNKGAVVKAPMFKNKELGTICRPKVSNQTGANEVYIFAEKGSTYRFGRLKF